MELFKRYVAASSMGVVALVCVLVGLLGVTVLRPPTHQVSSVVSATDLIMTRGNVLSIVKDDVTVTATSKSGAPVTLSIGTTQDVKGWIGDAAYTEVIGVESDRTKLKAESHAAVSTGQTAPAAPSTPAQSGAQSGVQSGAQPLADPTSADLVTQLASSDMWFKQASGEGTVSLDLENVPSGRSALAASAAGPDDLTLTLTWKVEQTNTLAIIAFLAACVFALIALALFLTRWQLLRLRKIREARIEERRKADSLETSFINSAAVAERVAAARDSAPAPAPVEELRRPTRRRCRTSLPPTPPKRCPSRRRLSGVLRSTRPQPMSPPRMRPPRKKPPRKKPPTGPRPTKKPPVKLPRPKTTVRPRPPTALMRPQAMRMQATRCLRTITFPTR